jgi:hypothetical protein
MENYQPIDESNTLSASKVKTLENCSWSFWCNYHLKLPQEAVIGTKKGSVCHWMFEVLLNKRHQRKVAKAVQDDTLFNSPSLIYLLKKFIKRIKLPSHDSIIQHIDQMIIVGLKSDFYVSGGTLVSPEYKFDIKNPLFRIKGFIDKPVIKGKVIYIDDFKSAKQKFKGEDEESNMQALFYSYAARKIWPSLTPIVRFIFLQYPDDPMMVVKFNDNVLKGFELYLAEAQKRVNVFNEFTAKSAFAFDVKPYDGGFNGKLLCGFATYPNQLKKDGTKMWHCPYKFPFSYYAIKKGEKVIKTAFEEADLPPLQEGETKEFLVYSGCPKHRNVLDDMKHEPKQTPKKYVNALDDF